MLALSCSKEESVVTDNTFDGHETDVLSFPSKEALENAIYGYYAETKAIDHLTESMISPISSDRFVSDPILNTECSMLNINPENSSGSVYEALGYDWLVPNKSFASLLNYKGEVEVQDTIYKVSPKGTYYFHKDYLDTFEREYEAISSSPLQYIGDCTYFVSFCLNGFSGDFYLKDTFGNGCEPLREDISNDENSNDDHIIVTKVQENDDWREALNINWNALDTHYTDASTWVGEIIEGIFGRNVSFETEFDSNHRLKAKLYYYDYVVYAEIGALSKMQKKNWIGWSGKEAEKIYQIWSNMVIWTPFQSTVNYPHVNTGNTIPREYLGTQIEYIPGIDQEGIVSYFAGRDLSEQELNNFASANYVDGVINLNINVDPNVLDTRTMATKYITERGVYTIIHPYGKMVRNAEEIQSKFSKDFHIFIGISLTPGANPDTFGEWLSAVSTASLNVPRLIQGEMRTAAKYNNIIKGMRLIKANED